MRITLVVLTVFLAVCQSAYAGAWVRDAKTGFLSVSATIRSLGDGWQSENNLYAEYGLAPRLTLGVDINEIPDVAGHVLAFARLPIGSPKGRTRLSLQMAVGGHHVGKQWAQMARATLSVGRGFSGRQGGGWFNVDAGAEWRWPNSDPAYKLDATVGLSSGSRIRPLLQFESTYVPGVPLIWSILPGVLVEGGKHTRWHLAFERKTAGHTSLGLRFGMWRSF